MEYHGSMKGEEEKLLGDTDGDDDDPPLQL